jgi:hypothetical protein
MLHKWKKLIGWVGNKIRFAKWTVNAGPQPLENEQIVQV